MYPKHQASQLRQEFWTAFGRYMNPVLSAEGEKINWINYKTGEKNIHFRMDTENRSASVYIELTHDDKSVQQLYYEHFQQLRHVLEKSLGEQWEWRMHISDEHGRTVSCICRQLDDVSVFNKEDWPALISFFKQRITALDAFWSKVKYGFEVLR